MKILKDRFLIICIAWTAVFYLLALILSKFYLFPLGLAPLAVYELIRVEGEKNTRPLSFLILVILIFQFLHTTKIYLFPLKVGFILDLLPVAIPAHLDKFLFLSVAVLIIFSLLLIRYTWGSVTKFLAILLLLGSIIQASLFWPEIKAMKETPEGQQLMEESQERIKDNIYYRLRQEL